MEPRYPRHSLGWAFQRVMRRWGISKARLARFLALSPADLVGLAVCPAPALGSPDFDARIDRLAHSFGIPAWPLQFVCRAAAVEGSPVWE